MPSRYSSDEEEAADSQALILQRLHTGPQPLAPAPPGSRAATPGQYAYHDHLGGGYESGGEDEDDSLHGGYLEEQTDELLEKRRQRALARQLAKTAEQDPVNSAGRPPWLVNIIDGIKRLSLIRKLALAAGALFVLSSIFYWALRPTDDGAGGHRMPTWNWSGNFWKGGKMPYDFPNDVGYPGPTEKGPPAQLAQDDTVSESGKGKKPWNALPVEVTLPGAEAKYGNFEPFLHMGPLTPYVPATGFGIDDGKYGRVPDGCTIEQVHYLSRHGSRYPTSGSPANLIHKLFKQSPRPVFSGPLSFLNTYEYRLGKELLVPVGRQQLYDEGVSAVISYGNLIYSDIASFGSLFARAGSQHRIVESARNWLAGALGVGGNWERDSTLEIQIEAQGFNTTLAPNFACPNAGRAGWDVGNAWKEEWIDKYAKDAVERLQPFVRGVTLTPKLINALQQVCSYDTVAGFDATSLCSLFTKEEWLGYEYAWDLEFYGGYSSGSSVGPAQGVGWINELLARLTGQPCNIQAYPSVSFRYVCVGNEVAGGATQNLVPAMENVQGALASAGLGHIKVTTSVSQAILGVYSPPSAAEFTGEAQGYMGPVVQFLARTDAPLLANIYPYFPYTYNPGAMDISYALFTASGTVVQDGAYGYQNLFDTTVDAFYTAMAKHGGSSVTLVVSESGWPSGGGTAASPANARIYNQNLINHVGRGTPRHPGAIETYLFSMFNENQKDSGVEQNWGLFYPNMQSVYPISF